MQDQPGLICGFQQFERLPDNAQLLGCVPGLAQGMGEWKLDRQGAWGANLLCPDRHHRDQHSGQTSLFQGACQHGHVNRAVRSAWSEQDTIHFLCDKAACHLRTIVFSPG